MTVDYPGAIDRITHDTQWVFKDALKGVPNGDLTIVNHKTAMGRDVDAIGVADFFMHDAQRRSCHFIVGLKGEIVQLVQLTDGAGANCCVENGYSGYWSRLIKKYNNMNLCTISIEHVDVTSDNSQNMPDAQVQASHMLNLWLVKKYGLDTLQIKSHMSLMPVTKARCPGPTFNFNDLFTHIYKNIGENVPAIQPWFMFPIIVPFGNVNYDSVLGGAHDLDVQPPPNYPVTALLGGVIESITSPQWGMQVGVRLDTPYNGVPYCAYLHLSAVEPDLTVGDHIKKGSLIGWVGGGNTFQHYAGTSNPTGVNFLNNTFNSTQIQVGFALMYGPEYGVQGWTKFPPIDWALNPTSIIEEARKEYELTLLPDTFNRKVVTLWRLLASDMPMDTEIFIQWRIKMQQGIYMGSPLKREVLDVDAHGVPTLYQPTNKGTLVLQTGKNVELI